MIDLALNEYADIKAGKGDYDDDEPFFVAGSLFTQNKLYTSDMSLLNHTQKPWPLLHPDGSITTEIIHSVRVPTTKANPSHSFYQAALKTTVTGYLSTYAIRVDPDKYGYGPEDRRIRCHLAIEPRKPARQRRGHHGSAPYHGHDRQFRDGGG